jgi:hypothetical protein
MNINVEGNGPILGPGGPGGMPDMQQLAAQMQALGKKLNPHSDSNLPGAWRRFDLEAYKNAYDSNVFQYMADMMQRDEAKHTAEQEGNAQAANDQEAADPKPLTEALGLLEALLMCEKPEMREKLKPYFPERAKLPEAPLKRTDLVPILEELFNTNLTPLRVIVKMFVSGSVQRWNPATLKDIPEDAPNFHPWLYWMINKIDPSAYYPAVMALMQLNLFAANIKIARERLSSDNELLDILSVMAVNNISILKCLSQMSRDEPESDGRNWVQHASEEDVEAAAGDMCNIILAMNLFLSNNFDGYREHVEGSRKQSPKAKDHLRKKDEEKKEGEEEKEEEKKEGQETKTDEDKDKDSMKSISHLDYLLFESELFCADLKKRSPTLAKDFRSRIDTACMKLRMSMFDDEKWALLKSGAEGEDLEALETMQKMINIGRGGPRPERCEYCGKPAAEGKKWKHCARCKKIWYCSAECQKDDWAEHRRECEVAGSKKGEEEEKKEVEEGAEQPKLDD